MIMSTLSSLAGFSSAFSSRAMRTLERLRSKRVMRSKSSRARPAGSSATSALDGLLARKLSFPIRSKSAKNRALPWPRAAFSESIKVNLPSSKRTWWTEAIRGIISFSNHYSKEIIWSNKSGGKILGTVVSRRQDHYGRAKSMASKYKPTSKRPKTTRSRMVRTIFSI